MLPLILSSDSHVFEPPDLCRAAMRFLQCLLAITAISHTPVLSMTGR
jgi:hypothetical protein